MYYSRVLRFFGMVFMEGLSLELLECFHDSDLREEKR